MKAIMLAVAVAMLAGVGASAANFPYIRLNNQTNRISDSGSALTRDGIAIGGGGSSPFTNVAGVVQPVELTNRLSLGVGTIPTDAMFYQEYSGGVQGFEKLTINGTGDAVNAVGLLIEGNDAGFTNNSQLVNLELWNNTVPIPSARLPWARNGQVGLQSWYQHNAGTNLVTGEGAAVQGIATSDASFQVGVSAYTSAVFSGGTNIAVTGFSDLTGTAGVYVGFYGQLNSATITGLAPESAVALLDAGDTGLPMAVFRVSNGTRKASIENNGSITTGGNTNRWILKGLTVDGGTTNAHWTINGTNFFSAMTPE